MQLCVGVGSKTSVSVAYASVETRSADREVETPCPGTSTVVALSDDDVSTLFHTSYTRLCQTTSQVLRGDRSAAEQVVMDAFMILYEKRDTVRRETASAYLWKIALNEARTVAARSGREAQLVDLATRRGALPGEEARAGQSGGEYTDEFAHVRALVDALPVDQRIAVVLHYYCDWPDAEIAAALGCPAVTIRSRLRRARKSLEQQLGRSHFG